MINDIYFAANDGSLFTNHELAKMAFVVNGMSIKADDLDVIREFAVSCKGILKEVNPSVKVCLKNGDKVKAVMIYRDRHPGMSLMEAKSIIDDMEKKMDEGILW